MAATPTPFQIRQRQRAIHNFYSDRYHLDGHPQRVNSVYDAHTAENTRFALWLLGMSDNQIRHSIGLAQEKGGWKFDEITNFIAHPSTYFTSYRVLQYKRHRDRLAQVRAPKSTHNLTTYKGLTVVKWIAPKLAKHDAEWGISGDQACGWRGPVGSGLQALLFKRWLAGVEPGPVAEPGKGMHEFCDCQVCRKQIAKTFGISEADAIGGACDTTNPSLIADNDLAPAGPSDPPHSSSRRFQNATGRY